MRALQKSYDVDLTYTSNAIEGNTLTLRRPRKWLNMGLPWEANRSAIIWKQLTGESTVRELHRRIVARSEPGIGGIYSTIRAVLPGRQLSFPTQQNSADDGGIGGWLSAADPVPATSFDAHFRLSAIHPFSDGNGRASRLLMNLLLLRGRIPPVAVRPEDRKTYLDTLEHASLRDDLRPFHNFMYERLDVTLTEYLTALQQG